MKSLPQRILGKSLHLLLGRGRAVTLTNARILAKHYGQYRTVKNGECVNSQGDEIPWYTYPAIEYLDNHDLSGLEVVEFGSGNSSLYYLRKGAHVTSIEDDRHWFEKVRTRSNERHHYVFAETKNEYVERPEVGNADIIVIDGSHRADCTAFVAAKILSSESAPSMIVFDNADWYPVSVSRLDKQLGWPRVDFCGFGPINDYTWVTSIFLNPRRLVPRLPQHISSIKGTGGNVEAQGTTISATR